MNYYFDLHWVGGFGFLGFACFLGFWDFGYVFGGNCRFFGGVDFRCLPGFRGRNYADRG